MTCVFLSFCLEGELISFSGLLCYKAVGWEVCCNLETVRRLCIPWMPIPTYNQVMAASRDCQSAWSDNSISISSQTGTQQEATQTQQSLCLWHQKPQCCPQGVSEDIFFLTSSSSHMVFFKNWFYSLLFWGVLYWLQGQLALHGMMGSALVNMHFFHRLTSLLSLEKWFQEQSPHTVRRPQCSSLWVRLMNCFLGTNPTKAQSRGKEKWMGYQALWVNHYSVRINHLHVWVE